MPSALNVSADGVFVYCYKEPCGKIFRFVKKMVLNPLTKMKKRYKLYLALKENEC